MFDLPATPPDSFAELRDALEQSARRRIDLPADQKVVTIDGDAWPFGHKLAVTPTGGRVEVDAGTGGLPEHLKPPTLDSDRSEGPKFDRFEVRGEPLMIDVEGGGPLPLTIRVDGREVGFDFGRSRTGTWVMAPASGDVEAELSVPREALLKVIEQKSKTEAAARGVKLTRLVAEVGSPSDQALRVVGRLEGSKKVAFFNANFAIDFGIDLVAEPDRDGHLVGRVAELDLQGDGPVMSVILGLARSVIDKAKRTPLPLSDVLAMAGVQGLRVRDVRVTTGETLTLHAELGDGNVAAGKDHATA